MWKRGEEKTAGRAEKSVRSEVRQKGNNKSEREGLQEDSEASYVVLFRGNNTDEKTGDGVGTGRVEDTQIFILSGEDGQD